jgi:hypothetical protein
MGVCLDCHFVHFLGSKECLVFIGENNKKIRREFIAGNWGKVHFGLQEERNTGLWTNLTVLYYR